MMRSYEQLSHEVVAGLENVCSKVVEAASKAKRNKASVSLIAVSKSQPSEKVKIALDYGCRIFGENRVQEALLKWDKLKPLYPDTKLHLIGNLQTNKVKEAVALFDFIHSVDRKKLASVISVGFIGDLSSINFLKKALNDEEANIRWDAAVSLAKLGDASGYDILKKLLTRQYYENYPAVNDNEINNSILTILALSTRLESKTFENELKFLANNEKNIKIREFAMKILSEYY